MSVTGLGELGTAADDLVKLIAGILQDREPIRHARIMNRLVVVLALTCEKNHTAPAVEVAITCAQLTPELQQQTTTGVTDELAATQPSISITQNKSIMSTNNQVTGLDLASRLAILINWIAIKLGGAKTNAFRNAVIAGMKAAPTGTAVTPAMIIGTILTAITKIAAITNITVFMQLATLASTIYGDIVNKTGNLILYFKQLVQGIQAVDQLKKEGATEAKSADPNLNADELSLAQILSTLCVQVALYLVSTQPAFGANKAVAGDYIAAIENGINYIYNAPVTDKILVDNSFGVAIDICALLKEQSLLTGLTVANNIYDDFAGGTVTVFNLEPRVKAEMAKIKAAA